MQMAKALHQMTLDGGSWLLIPCEDPLTKPTFAASERELERIYAFRRSEKELKSEKRPDKDGNEEDREPYPPLSRAQKRRLVAEKRKSAEEEKKRKAEEGKKRTVVGSTLAPKQEVGERRGNLHEMPITAS